MLSGIDELRRFRIFAELEEEVSNRSARSPIFEFETAEKLTTEKDLGRQPLPFSKRKGSGEGTGRRWTPNPD